MSNCKKCDKSISYPPGMFGSMYWPRKHKGYCADCGLEDYKERVGQDWVPSTKNDLFMKIHSYRQQLIADKKIQEEENGD